jgi:hypothetical protein
MAEIKTAEMEECLYKYHIVASFKARFWLKKKFK